MLNETRTSNIVPQ